MVSVKTQLSNKNEKKERKKKINCPLIKEKQTDFGLVTLVDHTPLNLVLKPGLNFSDHSE